MASWQQQSVASEMLVNDRTLVLPAPPVSLTTSGDLVWIALSDGKVEIHNARTGEVVRRFEPATATVKIDDTVSTNAAAAGGSASPAPASSAAGILSNLTNRVLSSSPAASGSGAMPGPSILKKRGEQEPSPLPSPAHVRSLLAVPVADGSTHVWLGLSNGHVEVHDGGDLLHNSVGAAGESASDRSFLAIMRRHTAAVTCLAEFGGFVYTGSEDQRIVQWRASQWSFVSLFASQSPHTGAVRCLYAEGNAVVSGSDDCTVKVWDVGEGTTRLTGYFHSRSGGVLSLCRVGELIWSGDAAGQVVRWHIRTCEAVAIHCPHRDRVLSLCHVGDRVYSSSADGTMGIFNAVTGQLLQQITDQALGWVTAVVCPAELSRFVVWSASSDGAVRCWYQDEYVSMSADELRFNDASWYECSSTPYREFRAAIGQRTNRLKRQLEATEQRDRQTMTLLRRCSTVFGGGGADFEEQQRRLQELLTKAEERCAAAQARQAQKREAVTQLDRDIAATLALLQAAKNELNQLLPGEAERLLATMATVNADDLMPYGQTPPPSSSSTAAASAALPASTAPTAYATGTAVPTGPPSALMPLPAPPTAAAPPPPLPPPATTSTLGVGGPLSTAPPPPPPSALPPPSSAVSTGTGASTNPPPPASSTAATTTAAAATAAAPVATTTSTARPPPSAPAAALPAAASRSAQPAMDDTVRWTNPHVGNYIQRRYYGASPSLRTIDLMRRERHRGRLPHVKVEPLQRHRSHSATSNLPSKSRTSSAAGKKSAATTATITTTVTAAAAKPAPSK